MTIFAFFSMDSRLRGNDTEASTAEIRINPILNVQKKMNSESEKIVFV